MQIGYRASNDVLLGGWLSDLGSSLVHPMRALGNINKEIAGHIGDLKNGISGAKAAPPPTYLQDTPGSSSLPSWALPAGVGLGVFALILILKK